MPLPRLSRLAVALLGSITAGVLGAQPPQQQVLLRGQTPGPRLMVPTLHSADSAMGLLAAEMIRTRMMEIPGKDLWIIPRKDIDGALEGAGFDPKRPLSHSETKQLATGVKAEHYLEGSVSKSATGYRIEAMILLARRDDAVQPLPVVEAAKLDKATEKLSDEVEKALKPLEQVQRCNTLRQQTKYAEALAAAASAIRAYAPSTLARGCILEIHVAQKAAPDSIIRVAEELLALHPANKRALALVADAYYTTGAKDKYVATLRTLVDADPTNTRLVETVVGALLEADKVEDAKSYIDRAIRDNPGTPSLTRLQLRTRVALKDYRGAATIADELVTSDSAGADTAFFASLVGLHLAAGDSAGAAQAAARGAAKFPASTSLLLTQAQLLRATGQTAQAMDVLRRAAASGPRTRGVWLQLARLQLETAAPSDTVLASLGSARAAGDSAEVVAAFATTLGNTILKRASAAKNVPELREAIHVFTWSDSVSAAPMAKFLIGVANLYVGQQMLQAASEGAGCPAAREAQEALNQAQIFVPRGASASRERAAEAMNALQALSPAADKAVKAVCK